MAHTTPAILFGILACLALPAQAAACGPDQYYAADDMENATALRSPHPDFKSTQAAATQGDIIAQRSLGALYESGYLVSACAEKAAYWYGKAAEGGDELAKGWLARHARIARMRDGPECFGGACAGAMTAGGLAGDGVRSAVLRADRSGSYVATVGVNGKSVKGIIDTGASLVSMSAKTAAQLGIDYSAGGEIRLWTANGTKVGRRVTLRSVTVENITLTNVEAAVSDADFPLLVGMSFLSRVALSTSNGAMTLIKR